VILRLAVLVEHRLVTDGRTDRETDGQTQGHGQYRGCIASRGKNGKQKTQNRILALRMNNTALTQASDVCNGFNQYFTTVGHYLVHDLVNNNPVSENKNDYIKYCQMLIMNNVYCEPVTKKRN